MAEHGYQQYCGAARALDVVGDRWTLLVVRELMVGPRRFADLIDGLPGISRSLLSDRLRTLQADGVVARAELPPPAARQVYELTVDGRDLAAAMVPLVAWGARRLGARQPAESFRPQWGLLAIATFANREAARGVRETYEYRIGRAAFHYTVDDGEVRLHDGRAVDPAVTVTTDEQTWASIAAGATTASNAAAAGRFSTEGAADAVGRLHQILQSRQGFFAQVERTIAGARQPDARNPKRSSN